MNEAMAGATWRATQRKFRTRWLSRLGNSRKSPTPQQLFDVVVFAALLCSLVWLTVRGAASFGYNWQWYNVADYIYRIQEGRFVAGPLLQGLLFTLLISFYASCLTLLMGMIAALARMSTIPTAYWLARSYVEIVR